MTVLSRIEDWPTQKDLAKITPEPAGLLADVAADQREHAYVRERAIALLGAYPSNAVALELIRLTKDRTPAIRQSAAAVLGRHFGASQPDEVLVALKPLLKDTNKSVRKQAIRAISYVHKREVVGVLTQRLALENDPALREFLYHRALQLEATFEKNTVAAR
ncbi:MAG: HEAT repeat domain-containing protein [Deltaproteobacteria bacterium]|nr:HEAT repeat domain-containing protein [Deltaproteobacteria bacterium]